MSLRARFASVTAAITAIVLPAAAHACAVCFSGSPRTRLAFFDTTIFLSLVPLGIIGGGVLWVRRHAKRSADTTVAEHDAGEVYPAP